MSVPTAVLVEGPSDAAAVRTLADRLGRDLSGDGVRVVAMGGATNAARFVRGLGPDGDGVALAGLYDVAEERFIAAALGVPRDVVALRAARFFRCEADLEDELIRAVGVAAAEDVIAEHGDLGSFRTLQHQPAQRDRTPEQQLHRFLGSGSGRKERYAALLTAACPLERVPAPLSDLLGAV